MPGATDGALEPVWPPVAPVPSTPLGSPCRTAWVGAARCGSQCRPVWRSVPYDVARAHDVTPVARVSLFARTLWSVQRRARHEAL